MKNTLQVMEAGTGEELDSSPALLNNINTGSKIALNRFGHLNTVTTVTGEANRVFVQVPQNLGDNPTACVGQTRAKSLAVKAYMVIVLIGIMVVMLAIVVIMVIVVIAVMLVLMVAIIKVILRWSASPPLAATTPRRPACCPTTCTSST